MRCFFKQSLANGKRCPLYLHSPYLKRAFLLDNFTVILLAIFLVLLIILSGFFSCAETGLMAVNRYRLRHAAQAGNSRAKRVLHLLMRPDRMLGVLLIGNNCANIIASSVATFVAVHFLGDIGVALAAFVMTWVVLIFAEVAPKTLATVYPEKISLAAAKPLALLLKIFYPLVWITNALANGLLKLFRIDVVNHKAESLSREELRSLVNEAGGNLSEESQEMLLSVLDLRDVTVDDIMIPRQEVVGLDLEDDWPELLRQIHASKYTRLPVYRGDLDDVIGFLHLRDVIPLITKDKLDKETLESVVRSPYFVPEGTPLTTQLLRFQQQRRRRGLVVDEYGDVQGLVTLESILEEIVGEYSTDLAESEDAHLQKDGSYLVDGSANLRDLNRSMEWDFATEGPKTLSGLITEYLEAIPSPGTCLRVCGYPMEVIKVKANIVKTVRIYAHLRIAPLKDDALTHD